MEAIGNGVLLAGFRICSVHPTALTKKGADRFLISEAAQGEGAHLVDSWRRFAFDYHSAGELHLE